MSDLLLFLLYFETSNVLFQLSLLDPMIILPIFELYLGLFFELRQLIKVLEHQVLHSLFVDFHFDLIFLRKILEFSLFIS